MIINGIKKIGITGVAIDDDEALVASSLEEYYLDKGAFFQFGATEFLNVAAESGGTPGQMQFELEHEANLVRVFGFAVSTLADRYKLEVWETDARDVSVAEDPGDIDEFPPFQVNRTNKKDFPGTLYQLSGAALHDLSGAGYELVYSDAFIMEGAGGPQAADAGAKHRASTAIQLDAKNYVFRLLNYDDTTGGRDFTVAIYMGVSDLCC